MEKPEPHTSEETEYLTVPQVAAVFKISNYSVLRLLERGELQGYNFGGHNGWRIGPKSFEALKLKVEGK